MKQIRPLQPNESQIQQACIQLTDLYSNKYPFLKDYFSIPNEGKRSFAYGQRLVKQGLRKGTPDMLFFIPNSQYHGLFIEFKSHKGKQSPEQLEMSTRIINNNYCYNVIRSLDEFIILLNRYFNINLAH